MAVVRWAPTRELDALQAEMNRLFDGFFNGGTTERTRRWLPAMDLLETKDHLVLRADLPGLNEDDVSIEVKDGVLTVSGERRAEQTDEQEGYYRFERAFGSFSRSLTLPEGIDPDNINAQFDRGVLEVRIPKPEERKAHRVEIGGGSVAGKAIEK
jgi:HSP20 family protein